MLPAQGKTAMPLLSEIARRKKIDYFLRPLPREAHILEIGCGSGWVGSYLRENGWRNYTGFDVVPPADIVGDIRDWRELGVRPESFDAIVAFEVVEHVACFQECYDLLRPGGRLLLTTPVPHMDWEMKLLEALRLNQRRTSPHDHLVYLEKVPQFEKKEIMRVASLAQRGIFTKQPLPDS